VSPALRVAVLAGGLSHEREVSLRSGRRVADALRSAGCEVEIRDVDAGLLAFLSADRPDVVFPVLHGASGEDGGVRDVLELLGLPYVGARPDACRRTFDKPVATSLVAAAGLQTPPSVALGHGAFRELGATAVLAAIVEAHGLPLVVKPARGGSALGVTVVADSDALPRAMVDCFAYGDVALVQRAVTGREVAVSVVDTGSGPRALPAVEIVAADGVYGYDARYSTGSTEYHAPARLSPAEAAAVADAAVVAHTALGLRDVSRTDLIVDDGGIPWFLETNVAPGMTEVSLLPQALAAAGEDAGALYRELVEQAASRA
jgi:D-alanine-D-alanine ligase